MGNLINIKIEGLENISNKLSALKDKTKNLEKPFARVSIVMLKDVMQHFKDESSPSGKWISLKPETLERRKKGKKKKYSANILRDTGKLFNSITKNNGKTFAKVGTNIIYANVHNAGFPKKNIPQREFMWLSDTTKNTIKNIFENWIFLGK